MCWATSLHKKERRIVVAPSCASHAAKLLEVVRQGEPTPEYTQELVTTPTSCLVSAFHNNLGIGIPRTDDPDMIDVTRITPVRSS